MIFQNIAFQIKSFLFQFDDGSRSRAQFNTSSIDERKMKVLIPISPKEFLAKLAGTNHPGQLSISAWGWYPQAIGELSKKKQDEYLRDQARMLTSILSRAKELSPLESKRKLYSDDVIKTVNVKKRLCLLEELLRAVDHPDMKIVDDLDKGFRLTGWLEPSGLFGKLVTPPQISRDTLEALSLCLNTAAINRCERNSSDDMSKALLDITLDELKRNWIVREVDLGDLEKGTILSPRFIIQQGEKSRAIDNFTYSNINSTVGTSEKIILQGVDEIASLIKQIFVSGIDDIVGRTYDMEAAYRQLPIHPDDRNKAVVCVYDPAKKGVRGFEMATMPFGAIASVHAFLRTAAAVNNIGCSFLGIPMTSYFDDFTVVTKAELSKGTGLAVQTLFEVLGLHLSTSDKKNLDFSKVFSALGVAFDLHKQVDNSFSIRNTEQRVKELVERIDAVVASGKLGGREAKGLRSRLSFACSQIYGRTSASVMKDLGRYETARHPLRLSGNTQMLLDLMKSHLLVGMPRKVTFGESEVVHLFTDGSLEGDDTAGTVAGIGAVLVDDLGNCVKAFSYVPKSNDVEVIEM